MGIFNFSKRKTAENDKLNLLPIGNVDSICPNCNNLLSKRPGKKSKCPHCSNYIYARTRPFDNVRVLVTEDQLNIIEEQWAIKNGTHDDFFKEKNEFLDTKKRLEQKFGGEVSDNDVKWNILNEEGLDYAKDCQWGLYRNTRFDMAEILNKESKYKAALSMYLEVCYLDLNGPTNYGDLDDIDNIEFKKDFSPI